MARFTVIYQMLTTGQAGVLAVTDDASEALKLARKHAEQGKRNVRIGDEKSQQTFNPQAFATQYSVR